jgi:hypothetical protein
MNRMRAMVVALLLASTAWGHPPSSRWLYIHDVTVIDATGAPAEAHRSVIVHGNRIVGIVSSARLENTSPKLAVLDRRPRKISDPRTLGHARPHGVWRLVSASAGNNVAVVAGQRHHGRTRYGRRTGSARAMAQRNLRGQVARTTNCDVRPDAGRAKATLPQFHCDSDTGGRTPRRR